MDFRRAGRLAGWVIGCGHCGYGREEPGGMGKPLFGPPPLVAVVFRSKIDAAAVAAVFAAGDAVGDAAALGAVAVVGVHIGNVVLAPAVEEADGVRVAAEDPGVLAGGVSGEGVAERGASIAP